MTTPTITVAGAGIVGLWQALTLARRGFSVRLIERSVEPFAQSASALAGAMLAPYCEAEAAAPSFASSARSWPVAQLSRA
jgi:glycine oxidase